MARAVGLWVFAVLACDGNVGTVDPIDHDPRPPNVDRATVATGVARLSARHVAALLKMISNDAACGFASEGVKQGVQLSGQPGDDGTATWTVTDCTLKLASEQAIDSDCDGNDLLAHGAATISATRTVHGVLQKGLSQPVAPDAANAATITLTSVTFDGLTVRQSGSDSWMTINHGTLSVTAVPQLAPDHKTGLCTVATPQLTMHGLTLNDADLHVVFKGRPLDVQAPSTTLELQVGPGPDHENWFDGEVLVWETRVKVPIPSDSDGLDPSYSPASFAHSYACNADLQQPIGGSCPAPRDRPAQGAAALSVELFAAVTRQLDKDTQCGFAKADFAGAPSGTVGNKGSMVWTLPAACTLTFAPGTVVDSDCNGKKTMLEGSVTVTGKKTLTGYLVGDPAQPVVPTSATPVTFDLVMTPNELRLSTSDSDTVLLAHSGTLGGSLEPQTGLDTGTGTCSIATPIAHLVFNHQAFVCDLDTGDTTVALTIDSSMLEAQTGSFGGKTNYLAGQAVSSGHMLQVPSNGAQPVLDPSYDANTFQRSFMCNPSLQMPVSDGDCNLSRTLGEAAARLMVRNTGAAMKLLNDSTQCGFQNKDILGNGSSNDPPGFMGSVSWSASACTVGASGAQPQAWTTDCDGVTTTIEGAASVAGTRVVRGLRYEADCGVLCYADAVYPQPEDCADFSVNMTLQNFAAGTPDGKLILHTGTLAAVAHPMQGKDASAVITTYDIGTPIVRFDNIDYSGGAVTLVTGAKTFNFTLGAAHLQAFSGAFKGDSNRLSGPITVDGVAVTLGTLKLNPSYDQAKFDHSYACTQNLVSTLPPN
jgi:hypothetical protein